MKPFAVQYYDYAAQKLVVLIRSDSLEVAIAACKDVRGAYVLHLSSDLQRHIFNGRPVWLDAGGREQPCPVSER